MNFIKSVVSKRKSGFTLIELVIYIAIFSVVATSLVSSMITIFKIQSKQASSGEVSTQLGFVLQNVTRVVQQSSLIDKVYEGSDQAATCVKFCSVQLRVARSASGCTDTSIAERVFIISDASGVYTKECDKAAVNLVGSRVAVNSFVLAQDNVVDGRSILNMDLSLTYISSNPLEVVTRAVHSAIGRASAAVFDSDLLPSGVSSSIGASGSKWLNGWFSGNVSLDGASSTLTVGSGSDAITKFKTYSLSIAPTAVAASSTSYQNFTVTGLSTTDKVFVSPGADFSGACALGSVRVSAADTLRVQFINPGAASCTPATSTWTVFAIRS